MTNQHPPPTTPRARRWLAPGAAVTALALLAAFLVFGTARPVSPHAAIAGGTAKSSGTTPTPLGPPPQTSSGNTARSSPTVAPPTASVPLRALAAILAEAEPDRRLSLLREFLRNWAASEPDAAADWAWAHQPDIEQGHTFSAIFDGASQKPDSAVRLTRRLAAEHPEEAHAFGRHLVHSLSAAGQFTQAADYAAASSPDYRTDLLTGAYHAWGTREPEQALRSAITLDDPLRQNAAFHATIDGWALTNPQTLTAAAFDFPTGADRTFALVNGLRRWIEKDPASAEAWVKTHPLTADESARALEE